MKNSFGHIKKLGKDHYHVFWSENGNRRSKRIHGDIQAARLYLAQRQLELGGGPRRLSWSRYWDLAVEPTLDRVSERTAHDYRRVWRKYLEPKIGMGDVGDTTWRYAEYVLNGIPSPSQARYAYRLWKKVANMAVRDGYLRANPIDRAIKLPEPRHREKRLVAKEEVLPLLEAAGGFKHSYLIALELGAGLRHEEACAVSSQKIREEDGYAIVTVNEALTSVGGRAVLKDTKTRFSEREAVVGEPFASYLLERLNRIPYSPKGQASPVTITHNWREWCRRHDMEYIPFGQMRSSYAMLQAEAGSLDSLVSLAMGHSDGTTKGTNYMRSALPAMKTIADNLARFLLD